MNLSTHAEEMLRRRFGYDIWGPAPLFQKLELEDPTPDELFDESIEIEPDRNGTLQRVHPKHGIQFKYKNNGSSPSVMTVVRQESRSVIDDFPRCPVCDLPSRGDPCPYCEP